MSAEAVAGHREAAVVSIGDCATSAGGRGGGYTLPVVYCKKQMQVVPKRMKIEHACQRRGRGGGGSPCRSAVRRVQRSNHEPAPQGPAARTRPP